MNRPRRLLATVTLGTYGIFIGFVLAIALHVYRTDDRWMLMYVPVEPEPTPVADALTWILPLTLVILLGILTLYRAPARLAYGAAAGLAVACLVLAVIGFGYLAVLFFTNNISFGPPYERYEDAMRVTTEDVIVRLVVVTVLAAGAILGVLRARRWSPGVEPVASGT